MVAMAYDRFGNPVPTPRDRPRKVPSTGVTVAVCIFVVALLAVCAWLGGREPEPEPEQVEAPTVRHDSLAPTYTCDGEIIRWYVLVDPDTSVQYLVNDRGGCTPRLDRYGTPIGTTTYTYE